MASSQSPLAAQQRLWTWHRTFDVMSIALVVRLAVVVYALAEPVWDGHYYDVGARRIASGLGYSEDLSLAAADGSEQVTWMPWAHYPVGYSGLLALLIRGFRATTLVGPMANVLTGALLAGVAHRLALHMFASESLGAAGGNTERRGLRALIAGLLVALHPGLVLYSGALMTEPLAALGMLAAIWCTVAVRRPWLAAAYAGILLGLTTLVRPNAILLVPFIGVASVAAGDRWTTSIRRIVVRSTAVGAISLLTVAPWTLRNCRVMDACALVSTNAGWNLVIGSAPGATGKFEFLVGHTPQGAPACDEGGQVAQDRCWSRYGMRIIRSDLRRWAALVPAKLHHTLDSEWFPINYLREARPDLVTASAHIAWGKALTGLQHLLMLAAALAVVGRSGRRIDRFVPVAVQLALVATVAIVVAAGYDRVSPTLWPLGVLACVVPLLGLPGSPSRSSTEFAVAGVILTTLATHAVFFGEDRYHLVISPAFAILAAGFGRRSAFGR